MSRFIEPILAIALAILWVSPLVVAFWAAFHNVSDAINFRLSARLRWITSAPHGTGHLGCATS